jgi:sugar/nucleoside kinase (ribokinase family)
VSVRKLAERTADLLAAKADVISTTKAVIGLDGFVDSIIRVVEQRDSTETFSVVPTISDFAQRVERAAGKSTNIELWVERVKIGGNGPIMANALAVFGTRVTYVGNVGYPQPHAAFQEFAQRATVYGIAEPATTDALEFNDGKLMFGKRKPLHEITWDKLVERVGRDRLVGMLAGSQLLGLQNWTMVPAMDDIWQHVLDEVCPLLAGRHTVFFDLADPESRDNKDIRHALELISKFQKYSDTYLGLNEKEAFRIGEVLGYRGATAGEAAVRGVAKFVQHKLKIAGVVAHPREYAVAANATGVVKVQGPFIEIPLISTGAGDHFNAGFCLGKLVGADDEIALQLAVGASGYYVRTATSPSANDLAGFLRTL